MPRPDSAIPQPAIPQPAVARSKIPALAPALVASLILHAGIAAAVTRLAPALQTPGSIKLPTPGDTTPPIRLGDPSANDIAVAWLGFEQPRQHHAAEASDIEQAALGDDADTPSPQERSQNATPQAPATPQTPAVTTNPQNQSPAEPAEPANPAADPAPAPDAETPATEPEPQGLNGNDTASESTTPGDALSPIPGVPSNADTPDPFAAPTQTTPRQVRMPVNEAAALTLRLRRLMLAALARPAIKEARGTQQPPANPQTNPKTGHQTGPAAPHNTTAATSNPAAAADPSTPGPGRPRQAQADPFAVQTTLDKIEATSPIVGKGISIKTVRPEWSTVTRLLNRPRDPVVILEFENTGRVKKAAFATDDQGRPQRTGAADVDGPLIDALYFWRASGERIDALEEGQTLAIRLRISM